MTPLPCAVCARPLEPAFTLDPSDADESTPQQPSGAVTFTSRGQYGSTVFDPMTTNVLLEINVCDECVIALSRTQPPRLVFARVRTETTYAYSVFDPASRSNTGGG